MIFLKLNEQMLHDIVRYYMCNQKQNYETFINVKPVISANMLWVDSHNFII